MKIEKALIFAAGFGKRLAPITDALPKPLVKVGGKALIRYHIEKLVGLGITDIVINTHWLKESLVEELGNGELLGASISWSHEEQILETGGGMQNALHLLGDKPFLVVSADVWTDYSFVSLLEVQLEPQLFQSPKNDSLAHLVLVENPEHNLQGDFSVSSVNERNISHPQLRVCQKLSKQSLENLAEKDHVPNDQTYTYSGIGVFRPEFIWQYLGLNQAQNIAGDEIKPYPLREPLNKAIEEGLVTAEIHRGQWHDIGTIERLHKLEEQLAQNSM